VGVNIVPVASRTIMEEDDEWNSEDKLRLWSITPMFTVGVAVGG